MKIIKTPAQAKAELAAKARAEQQTKICPGCGENREAWRCGLNNGISYIEVSSWKRNYYRCLCYTCGCEWMTDKWKEV